MQQTLRTAVRVGAAAVMFAGLLTLLALYWAAQETAAAAESDMAHLLRDD